MPAYYCPHCGFGPHQADSGTIIACGACQQAFGARFVPPSPTIARLVRRRKSKLAAWLNVISLFASCAGLGLGFYAYSIRQPDLLAAGQALVLVGFILFLCSRFARALD